MFAECGCGGQPERCNGISGKGWLVESPTLDRLNMHVVANETHNLFVVDWFFVATPRVARSFVAIYDDFWEYMRALQRRGFGGSPWAHFFWAHHLTEVLGKHTSVRGHRLAGRNASLAFLPLLQGPDFTLARFVRFGRDCEAPVRRRALLAMPKTAARLSKKLAERVVNPLLEAQCPPHLQHHTSILCPWDTPACAGAHAESVVAALRRTEAALALEGLPGSHAYDRFYMPKPMRLILSQSRFAHVRGELLSVSQRGG